MLPSQQLSELSIPVHDIVEPKRRKTKREVLQKLCVCNKKSPFGGMFLRFKFFRNFLNFLEPKEEKREKGTLTSWQARDSRVPSRKPAL